MKHLFYFIAILPILWELMTIKSLDRVHNFMTKSIKKKHSELTKTERHVSTLQFGYFIWIFVGLFSFQRFVFAAILVLAFIPKRYKALRFIDALITLLILVFIVINAYHLKIDIASLY